RSISPRDPRAPTCRPPGTRPWAIRSVRFRRPRAARWRRRAAGDAIECSCWGEQSRRLEIVGGTLDNWQRQPGRLGDVPQRVPPIRLVQHPEKRELPLGNLLVSTGRAVQAAPSKLWLTIRGEVQVHAILFQCVENAEAEQPG